MPVETSRTNRSIVGLDGPLKVRKQEFAYPDDLEVCWNPQLKEFACVANSISLLMPYLEPYVVKSVARAHKQAKQENLLSAEEDTEITSYLGQETQHHIQHRKFNDHLRARYSKLSILEGLADRLAKRLLRSASMEYNLSQSAASEAFAFSVARWTAQYRTEIFAGADPLVADLFKWHMAEEVEHKHVVFNLWSALTPSFWRYRVAAVFCVLVMAFFVITGATTMMAYEKRIFSPLAWFRLIKWGITFAFELLPNLLVSSLKDFHPDQFVDPVEVENWLIEFDLRESEQINAG